MGSAKFIEFIQRREARKDRRGLSIYSSTLPELAGRDRRVRARKREDGRRGHSMYSLTLYLTSTAHHCYTAAWDDVDHVERRIWNRNSRLPPAAPTRAERRPPLHIPSQRFSLRTARAIGIITAYAAKAAQIASDHQKSLNVVLFFSNWLAHTSKVTPRYQTYRNLRSCSLIHPSIIIFNRLYEEIRISKIFNTVHEMHSVQFYSLLLAV